MLNCNLDRNTYYKILMLKKQCQVYLLLSFLIPKPNSYYIQALKCLELAKELYAESLSNQTKTFKMVA